MERWIAIIHHYNSSLNYRESKSCPSPISHSPSPQVPAHYRNETARRSTHSIPRTGWPAMEMTSQAVPRGLMFSYFRLIQRRTGQHWRLAVWQLSTIQSRKRKAERSVCMCERLCPLSIVHKWSDTPCAGSYGWHCWMSLLFRVMWHSATGQDLRWLNWSNYTSSRAVEQWSVERWRATSVSWFFLLSTTVSLAWAFSSGPNARMRLFKFKWRNLLAKIEKEEQNRKHVQSKYQSRIWSRSKRCETTRAFSHIANNR